MTAIKDGLFLLDRKLHRSNRFFYYEKGLSNDLGGLSFGQDANGNWGYKVGGADTVHPFKSKITMSFKLGNTPPNLADRYLIFGK